MLSSLVITLREGFEAALLIGLLLAVAKRLPGSGAGRWIWLGVLGAALTSVVAGTVLFITGAELEGAAEVAFEGGAMLAAALVLAWMMLWMGRHAHLLQTEVGEKVAAAGSAAALFWLAFLVVVREGLETALFLFAAVGSNGDVAAAIGAVTGLAAAAVLGYAVYRGGARLDLRLFFTVMNALLLVVGTYLVWRGVAELGELGAGGEAGELAGPVAAGVYALVVGWLLFRRRSPAPGASTRPATGAAERAPAGSPSRR